MAFLNTIDNALEQFEIMVKRNDIDTYEISVKIRNGGYGKARVIGTCDFWSLSTCLNMFVHATHGERTANENTALDLIMAKLIGAAISSPIGACVFTPAFTL